MKLASTLERTPKKEPESSMPETPSTSKYCPTCPLGEMRRLNRRGFWERRVLSLFGYYPWECVLCRKRRYRKGAGIRHSVVQTR